MAQLAGDTGNMGDMGNMGRFQHGGDTYGLGDVVDFSASLSPIGMPVQVMRALKVAAATFDAYPDPLCRDLVAAIAEREGIDAARVVATAGAGDALARLAAWAKPEKALVCSPCYSGYEQALAPYCARVVHHSLVASENFDVTDRFLEYIEPELDMIVLCTPNNPTGRIVDAGLLGAIVDKARDCDALVVVDECFLDLAGGRSCLSFLGDAPNLAVVKAFTKTYAMAGFRLGYCLCGSGEMAHGLQEAGVPWAVSTPAQVAGLAALQVEGYVKRAASYVVEQRAVLDEGLKSLGMQVVPSEANFILFQSPAPLHDALLARGFLVRRCGNFRGLDDTWYRVAVRTADENARLLAALAEVLA